MFDDIWDPGNLFQYCTPCQRDGHRFLLIDSNATENHDDFYPALRHVLGLQENAKAPDYLENYQLTDYYGYNDQFDVCIGCDEAVEIVPSSGLSDPHWMTESGVLCKRCTINEVDDYIKYLVSRSGKPHLWRLGEELLIAAQFVEVLTGLENGLHEGQNDDPRKLRRWARRHGLEAIFLLEGASQFDTRFGLWLRHEANDDGDYLPLTGTEYEEVRAALLVDKDARYPSLRYEFGQWPTPADNAKQMLRGG